MTDEYIVSNKTQPFEGQPHQAILALTRTELNLFLSLRPGSRRKKPIIGGMTEMHLWPDLVLAGPMVGAPQAVMAVEILARRGITRFLSLGWCGSLQSGLRWGAIVLPERAVSEEGTSAHYPTAPPPPTADPALSDLLAGELKVRQLPYNRGCVWTTDAPFRETKAKIAHYAGDGLLAVDMESSALMSVAAFRNLAWSGLMVVSDELWGETWRPGFNSEELKNGLRQAAEVVLEVAGRAGDARDGKKDP